MPSGEWESVTVPGELLDRLDEHREDNDGRRAYWEVIEDLLDAHDGDLPEDALVERVDRIEERVDDLPRAVSERIQTDLR